MSASRNQRDRHAWDDFFTQAMHPVYADVARMFKCDSVILIPNQIQVICHRLSSKGLNDVPSIYQCERDNPICAVFQKL